MAKKINHPYEFDLRSREAMTQFIAQDWRGYYDRHECFLLSWDVKAYDVDLALKPVDFNLEARFDDGWRAHAEEDHELFYRACDDASSYYTEGLYCSYPGHDQGDFEFHLRGRGGGHMCLHKWRGYPLSGSHLGDRETALTQFCVDLDFKELRAFYIAIVCLDHDLTPAKASAEVSYCIAGYREQWEDEKREAETDGAREQEEARPDMYDARGVPCELD